MSASHSPVCAERDEVRCGEKKASSGEILRHVPEETARKLRELAERYETADFSDGDPSFILKRYTAVADVECSAFVAAVLAFGRRDQFIPKIESIFAEADKHGGPEKWLRSGSYASFGAVSDSVGAASCEGAGASSCSTGAVSCATSATASTADKKHVGTDGGDSSCKTGTHDGDKKFYRFYSYSDMTALFARLHEILEEYGTLGNCVKTLYERAPAAECASLQADSTTDRASPASTDRRTLPQTPAERLLFALEAAFSGCRIVPQGKSSAAKRLCMFLRWMVRRNSPVDTGLWSWAQPKDLIIPLDTHVLQESVKMGLLPEKAGATLKTALTLTSELKEIWPDDPCKGDFALFGLGVDK